MSNDSNHNADDLLSPKKTAKLFDINVRSLPKLENAGLPAIILPGLTKNNKKYDPADVNEFKMKNKFYSKKFLDQ